MHPANRTDVMRGLAKSVDRRIDSPETMVMQAYYAGTMKRHRVRALPTTMYREMAVAELQRMVSPLPDSLSRWIL
jgi:hypothetical protein